MFERRAVRLLKVRVSSLTPTITATGFLFTSMLPVLSDNAEEAKPKAKRQKLRVGLLSLYNGSYEGRPTL